MPELCCDYLIVGAGATSLAFLDELVHGSTDLEVVVCDRRAQPGGHWTDAYDFVTLHQPAALYGVNSRPLGRGGLHMSSKIEVAEGIAHTTRVYSPDTALLRAGFRESPGYREGHLASPH